MAKKTKEQRKAIRKQGWKDAAQGLHEMYGKASMDAVAAMGKGFTKGVSSGRSNKNQPIRENMIGKGIAGLGGAVVEGIKNIPNTIKTMAKGNWKLLKGVFRGIFNHPDWWTYRNVLSVPAYNENRPFDPVAIKSVMGVTGISGTRSAPSIGVTHIVKNNVEYKDVSTTKSFDLAMIEAFKAIRLDLKSNLPYSQSDYNDFIRIVMTVAVKAKAIERVLGWYNVSRADIPELQKAVLSLPVNTSEQGRVTSQNIALVDDTNYPVTLNKYNQLKTICANIAIPVKLMEYISWWMGSVFIDQSAPNPQLYMNELRKCPIYGFSSTGTLTEIGQWDVLTGNIDSVIDEALALLNHMGIMNADIIKTNRYGTIQLANVENGVYQPVTLCDPEFFTILINSYTTGAGNYADVMNAAYARVDVLEGLNSSNLVGVTNALATWSGTIVPFSLVSQAAYFTADSQMNSGRNFAETFNMTTNVTRYQEAVETGDYWYQITGYLNLNDSVKIVATSTTITNNYNSNNRIGSGTQGGTLGTVTYHFPSKDAYAVFNEPTSFSGTKSWAIAGTTTPANSWLYIQFTFSSGVCTGVAIMYKSGPRAVDGVVNMTGATTVATLTSSNFTVSTASLITTVMSQVNLKYSSLTVVSGQETTALGAFMSGFEITNAMPMDYMNVNKTTTATTLDTVLTNKVVYAQFAELVDYHIPMLVKGKTTFTNGTNSLVLQEHPTLYKQTYTPLLFNASDVTAVLYWMYLGLFSMV